MGTHTLLEGSIWVISLGMIVGSSQPVGRFSFCGNHGGCLKERKQRPFTQRFLLWGTGPAPLACGGHSEAGRGAREPHEKAGARISERSGAYLGSPAGTQLGTGPGLGRCQLLSRLGRASQGCRLTALQCDLQEAGRTPGSTSVGVGRFPELAAAERGTRFVSACGPPVVCL